jgi:hypothetical protein
MFLFKLIYKTFTPIFVSSNHCGRSQLGIQAVKVRARSHDSTDQRPAKKIKRAGVAPHTHLRCRYRKRQERPYTYQTVYLSERAAKFQPFNITKNGLSTYLSQLTYCGWITSSVECLPFISLIKVLLLCIYSQLSWNSFFFNSGTELGLLWFQLKG